MKYKPEAPTHHDLNEQSYDKIVEHYHDIHHDEIERKPFDRGVLSEFAEQVGEGKQVLDLGPGPSCQQARFLQAQKNLKLWVVDLSKQAVEFIQRQYPKLQASQMNMLELGFPNQHFDGICAFYSLIHLNEHDLGLALKEAARVLKPQGHFILAMYLGNFEGINHGLGHDFYYRCTSIIELKSLITQAGLEYVWEKTRSACYPNEFPHDRIYILARKN